MKENDIIHANLNSYLKLSDAEFRHVYNSLTFKQFNKGENLHQAGNICDSAFFIIKGSIRYFNLVDGEEITGQFFFEGAWYSDYESFLLNKPSEQTIQTMEQTKAALLSKKALNQLYDEIPRFEKFGRLMAENAFMGLRKRTESLTHQSAMDRYVALCTERPKVIQRVAQKYIASYLDIKPQSLSRIRSQLLKSN